MHGFQLYRMDGQRAIPLALPDPRNHPKGKILDVLGYSANPGASLSFGQGGTIIVRQYGLRPKEGHWDEDYSRFGIKGLEDVGDPLILFIG